jgi:hypothetical protein
MGESIVIIILRGYGEKRGLRNKSKRSLGNFVKA